MLQLRLKHGVRIFALILTIGAPAYASELCATIMDLARLPLPSASVRATDLATGKAYLKQSDKSGIACFSSVPAGLYAIDASLTGFLHVKYYPVLLTPAASQKLSFWLPFSEITEGGLGQESIISGTLLNRGSPADSAEICIVGTTGAPKTCTTTNDLGEYALAVPAGVHQIEIRIDKRNIYKSKLDVSTPGIYRDRLSLDGNKEKP